MYHQRNNFNVQPRSLGFFPKKMGRAGKGPGNEDVQCNVMEAGLFSLKRGSLLLFL